MGHSNSLGGPGYGLMTISSYEIKPLGEEEVELLYQHIAFDWANWKKHRQRLDRQREGHGVYLVAWDENLPVGHAFLRWDGPSDHPIASKLHGCPDIEDLFVSPDFRSRGIGSQLLNFAERLTKQKGYSQVSLGVDIDNPRARALYDRRGYGDAGFGVYKIRWRYSDRNGNEQWAEENCNYLIKPLSGSA